MSTNLEPKAGMRLAGWLFAMGAALQPSCSDDSELDGGQTGTESSGSTTGEPGTTSEVGSDAQATGSESGSDTGTTWPSECDPSEACYRVPALELVDGSCQLPDTLSCLDCELDMPCLALYMDVTYDETPRDLEIYRCVAEHLRDGVPGVYEIGFRDAFGSLSVHKLRVLGDRRGDNLYLLRDDVEDFEPDCFYEASELMSPDEFQACLDMPAGEEHMGCLGRRPAYCGSVAGLRCPAGL